MATSVEIEEVIEGERVQSTDNYFLKIGEPLPLLPSLTPFDPQNPPFKPLVLSQPLSLLFSALPHGFCVAKMKDVVEAAKEIKDKKSERSVTEVSVVEVPIGRVTILALSLDSSFLAAVVGPEIHLFSVDSLLEKEQKPTFSCSVESKYVKDMVWMKDTSPSFVVLTDSGILHVGGPHKPLKEIMDGVDSVERSIDGRFVAIAKKSTLRILSAELKEILHISLPVNSWGDESGSDCTVKVDSIRWVRSDCIVVGCHQQTEDGEQNYLVQVIRSRESKFIYESSELAAISFEDLFLDLDDNIVPSGCGPHLFLAYLENCALGFVSNRKSTDEHIMLLSWSQEIDQVCGVDIERNTYLPKVELQDCGEENLVLGLCIDKDSFHENVNVVIGVEEPRELPSHCVLLCLTLEGKLIMYNFTSVAEPTVSDEAALALSDNIPVVAPKDPGEAALKSEQEIAKQDPKPSDMSKYSAWTSNPDQNLRKEVSPGKLENKESVGVEAHKHGDSEISDRTSNQFATKSLNQFSQKDHVGGFTSPERDVSGSVHSKDKNEQFYGPIVTGTGHTGNTPVNVGSEQNLSSSGSILRSSPISNARSPFFSPNTSKSNTSESALSSTSPANNTGSFIGNGSYPSDRYSPSIGQISDHSQKTVLSTCLGETPLGSSNSELLSQNCFTAPSGNNGNLMKGNHTVPSTSGRMYSDQRPPQQFGNVQNMAHELDKLLECIEKEGGFKFVCTTAHESSLKTLEEGMESLCERSRQLQSFTEDQQMEIQLLLDKTVQVLARKSYMEGIVSQTTDRQYWDLWNRRKLSSELDMKQQNILNLSQDLIDQMIELEKHFNALELKLFGEGSGVDDVSRALQRNCSPLRPVQSLQAIHSATISQLAAAQQLSESLSRQMAALNVQSPAEKQVNIKKQLFESIGLSDPDNHHSSPNLRKVIDSTSNKSPSLSRSRAANESRRNQLSGMSNHDPETARRRRDSLDRNWANFETPKTTVKRILIEKENHNVSSSSSSLHTQLVSPTGAKESQYTFRKSPLQDGNGSRDTSKKVSADNAFPFKWAGANPAFSQVEVARSHLQVSQGNGFPAISNSQSSPLSSSSPSSFTVPNMKMDKSRASAEVTGTLLEHVDKPRQDTVKDSNPFGFQFVQEQSHMQRMQPQLLSSVTSTHTRTSDNKETTFADRKSLFESSYDAQFFAASASTSVSSSSGSPFSVPAVTGHTTTTPAEDQSVINMKTAKGSESQVSRPLFSASFVSPAAAHANSIASKESRVVDSNSVKSFLDSAKEPPKTEPQPPSGSSTGSTLLHHQKCEPSKEVGIEKSPPATPQLHEKSESSPKDGLKLESKTPYSLSSEAPQDISPGNSLALARTATLPSSAEQIAPTQQPQSTSDILVNDVLKSEAFKSPAVSSPFPNDISSGSSFTVNKTSTPASNEISNTQGEQLSAANAFPSSAFSNSGSSSTTNGRNVDAPISQEDEMEEEAPETNASTDFSLGSLASFGLGSAPSTTAPKSNPFGGQIGSLPPNTSSLNSLSVPSGELFRPASFNFQSLQASQQSQPPNVGAAFGGFGLGAPSQQPPSTGGFGQPSQVGSGQQALGSVLGSFGQSRQLGAGLPGVGFGASPPGGGFMSAAGGGFANVSATSGGFSGISPTSGGFAGLRGTASGFAGAASTGGGFAAAGPTAGGFGGAANLAGGGFAAAASGGGGFGGAAGSGGFGAFSNQGTAGFSSLGSGGAGGRQPPSALFTQIRK